MSHRREPVLGRAGAGDSTREYLASHRMFANVPEPVLERLAESAVPRDYARGHHLYYAGDPLNYLVAVRSGLVVMTDLDRRGNRRVPLAFGSGDILGLVASRLGGRWNFTATVVTEASVLLLPVEVFLDACEHSPVLIREVTLELARMVIRSERATVRFSLAPVVSRLAAFLLERSSALGGAGQQIPLEFSHQDLSLLLGTTRESISRSIARLARSGVIRVEQQRVEILKPDALRALAES